MTLDIWTNIKLLQFIKGMLPEWDGYWFTMYTYKFLRFFANKIYVPEYEPLINYK